MQRKKVSGRKSASRSAAIRLAIEICRRTPFKEKSATSKGGTLPRGIYSIKLRATDKNGPTNRNRHVDILQTTAEADVRSGRQVSLSISLRRSAKQRASATRTRDQAFWSLIRS